MHEKVNYLFIYLSIYSFIYLFTYLLLTDLLTYLITYLLPTSQPSEDARLARRQHYRAVRKYGKKLECL